MIKFDLCVGRVHRALHMDMTMCDTFCANLPLSPGSKNVKLKTYRNWNRKKVIEPYPRGVFKVRGF
jgi:hypothetical protein